METSSYFFVVRVSLLAAILVLLLCLAGEDPNVSS
jgi:hypothetical protein